jgi:F420-non-reducing hydrogenase iron-sulfur subunit
MRAEKLSTVEDSLVTAAAGIPVRTKVTAFVCANCGHKNGSAEGGARHWILPVFKSLCEVQEIETPCTGRLQPEHLLRAVEAGADLVCVVACEESNCHFLEGSRRVRRRVEYVQHLLEEIKVGGEHILLLHLPGTARQDMAAKAGREVEDVSATEWARYVLATSTEAAERLRSSPLNPLHRPGVKELETIDMPTEEGEENED